MALDYAFFAKVLPALMDTFNDQLAQIFNGRLYALVGPPSPIYPFAVYQSQDAGGFQENTIGSYGWTGLITFRCIDIDLRNAWNKAQELAISLPTLEHVDYDIVADIANPQWFPVERLTEGSVYTAGLIIKFSVYPKIIT